MSELSERLIEAAETEIGNYCIHTDPVSEGCDCSVQARRAVVAMLQVLAAERSTDDIEDDPIWPWELAEWADEIEAR